MENFADAATLMLVAATLVVTGVGVLAAMLAVWGYKEIKDAATKAAVDEAIKEVKATVPALVARALMESRPVETGPRDADAIAEAVEKDQDEP